MIEHIPDPIPSDRATPTRKVAAWELAPECCVCGEVVRTLELARVIPFDDGDRVAHGACITFREERGRTVPPLASDFGMRG